MYAYSITGLLLNFSTNITDLHGLEILSHHYCWMRWEPTSMFICLEFCLYKSFSLLVLFCNLQPWRTYKSSKVAYRYCGGALYKDIYVAAAYKTAFGNGCRYLQCLTDAISLADNRILENFCLCCTTCDIGLNLLSLSNFSNVQCWI